MQKTPRSAAPSLRLQTVLSSCLSLQADLGSSWRQARFSAFDNITVLENAKKDLNRPPPTTWKADPKYQKVRMKISDLRGSQTERSARGDLGCGASTERPGGYSLLESVEDLRYEPRPFGELRTSFKPEIHEKVLRRPSTLQDMQVFWRSEITKYNTTRSNLRIASTSSLKVQENRQTSSVAAPFRSAGNEDCSSLHRFVLNYSQLRQLRPDQFQESLRLKQEAKMRRIKPSPDVLKLAEKYLPKHFKRIKPAQKQDTALPLPGPLLLPQQGTARAWELLDETPEEEVMRDVQRERKDREHRLTVEKILNKKEVSKKQAKRQSLIRII